VAASVKDTKSIPTAFQTAAEYAARHLPPGAGQLGYPGTTGTVFQVRVDPTTRPTLEKFAKRLRNRVTNSPMSGIRDGTTIVVKVIPAPKGVSMYWNQKRDMNRFVRKQTAEAVRKFLAQSESNQHHALVKHSWYLKRGMWIDFVKHHAEESVVHEYLAAQKPLKFRCTADRAAYVFVHPSDVAQQFYFAGSDAKSGVYVIVSRKVDGFPLSRYSRTAAIAASLQRATMLMHAFGVAHADAHPENVLVTPDGSVRFIDFGMSAILPPRIRESAEKAVHLAFETSRSGKAWPSAEASAMLHGVDSANRYLNSALRLRGFAKYFNPDGKQVKFAMQGVDAVQMRVAQRRVWSMDAECKKILG
jgi:serine/threonine protein kinase